MGLLALPALWAGRDGATVMQLMTEAVERIVPLNVSFVDVPFAPDAGGTTTLRLDGRLASSRQRSQWQEELGDWGGIPIGYSSRDGSIWFGSLEPAFPSVTQAAFLRAAASLGATGLQAARITHEREQASRAKDEFLAMLGHELRNPLAPIVTCLELVKRHGPGSLSREFGVIERQVSHLRRLVDDLMDVSRIAQGKVELKKEVLSIRALLLRAVEAVNPSAQKRGHELVVDLPDDAAWVLGDATRLTQVFVNLLTNSVKYTEPNGKIRIWSRVEGESISIGIKDNGAGISDELLPRLFGIFEQGRSTIDRAGGGLGIGLALVKSFVELHGGQVSVITEGAGRGAEFIVRLPLVAPQSDAAATTAPVAALSVATGLGIRVLLVDDNADGVEAMATALRHRGFDVSTATHPVQALAAVEDFRPTIAVLDLGLPGMDGYQLATELQTRLGPEAPRLIALSGYGQANDRDRSAAAGFGKHLAKPVDLNELIAILLPEVR
jgi:signal transduction histidine kinase/CheY-like chemotaxis protein